LLYNKNQESPETDNPVANHKAEKYVSSCLNSEPVFLEINFDNFKDANDLHYGKNASATEKRN